MFVETQSALEFDSEMVFPNSNPVILLAEPQDTPRLAAITTRAFEASDAIFPLVWGNTAPGAHDAASLMLFNPLQSDTKVTWKVEIDGNIVGYARWFMSVDSKMAAFKAGNEVDGKRGKRHADIEKVDGTATAEIKQKMDEGWKTPDGMNFDLFMRKVKGSIECKQRDYDAERDIMLDLCFVDPEYQKLGIGNMLLQWGLEIADKQGRKICLVSTPQARRFYEKGGWVVRKSLDIDLEAHGGSGKYGRCWMIREVQQRKY